MVDAMCSSNESSVNRSRSDDFPTPASPISKTLKICGVRGKCVWRSSRWHGKSGCHRGSTAAAPYMVKTPGKVILHRGWQPRSRFRPGWMGPPQRAQRGLAASAQSVKGQHRTRCAHAQSTPLADGVGRTLEVAQYRADGEHAEPQLQLADGAGGDRRG